MNLQSKYRVKPNIKLRREKFGGLIYDHAEGRLQFVHSHLMMRFLENDGSYSVQEMAGLLFSSSKLPENVINGILVNLGKFAQGGIIDEV